MVKYFLTTAILFVVPNIMSVNYAYAAGTAYLSDTYDTYGLRSTIDPAKDKQVFSWTGGYGGVFLGSANSTTTATETRTVGDDTDLCAPAGTPDVPVGMFWCNVNNKPNLSNTPTPAYNKIGDSWGLKTSGAAAGITAGYNYQFEKTNYVVGAETDFGYLGLRGQRGFSPASIDDTTLRVKATTYATARLRLGYAFDRFLVFATAGVAIANFNSNVEDQDTPVGVKSTPTNTQFGYVLGAGAEYALTDHWIIKGDFMTMNFSDAKSTGYVNLTCYPGIATTVCDPTSPSYWKTTRLSDPKAASAAWNIKHTVNLIRVGMNYKF